jgi:hypothetical protein
VAPRTGTSTTLTFTGTSGGPCGATIDDVVVTDSTPQLEKFDRPGLLRELDSGEPALAEVH